MEWMKKYKWCDFASDELTLQPFRVVNFSLNGISQCEHSKKFFILPFESYIDLITNNNIGVYKKLLNILDMTPYEHTNSLIPGNKVINKNRGTILLYHDPVIKVIRNIILTQLTLRLWHHNAIVVVINVISDNLAPPCIDQMNPDTRRVRY